MQGRAKAKADTGPKRSAYITPGGYAALDGELDNLWVRRRDVVKHLSAAAAEGDRSENAEYIYRKKQLREMDRRIRYLQKRLPELEVVNRPMDAPVTKSILVRQSNWKMSLVTPSVIASWGLTNLTRTKVGLALTHRWPKPCCAIPSMMNCCTHANR